MATPKRPALGRGLDSLIDMGDTPARGTSAISDIELDKISPNPDQPRTDFDQEAIEELSRSIREHGIIQPLSLRKTGQDTYQIIAGERRYRAARLAGLTCVPAYIRTATDSELTEMALIENIQREDLNAIEIALTFRKLMDRYEMTQERLAERLGKKRTTIANFLRLLRLPAQVQLGLRDRKIDMGHARAILSVSDPTLQLKLYAATLRDGLSVRKVEELARKMEEGLAGAETSGKDENSAQRRFASADFDILRKHLAQRFQSDVKVACDKNGKGRISFPFATEEELERLIAIFDTARIHD